MDASTCKTTLNSVCWAVKRTKTAVSVVTICFSTHTHKTTPDAGGMNVMVGQTNASFSKTLQNPKEPSKRTAVGRCPKNECDLSELGRVQNACSTDTMLNGCALRKSLEDNCAKTTSPVSDRTQMAKSRSLSRFSETSSSFRMLRVATWR